MASTPPTTLVTADELWRLPDDGLRHELVDGELRTMTPGGAEHGQVSLRIGVLLDQHVGARSLGSTFGAETGFRLSRDPDTVRAPAVAFVSRERAEREGRVQGYWPGPPDLAVEVVSPGDASSAVHEKALGWLAAGARLVLVVDPAERLVRAYRPPGTVEVFTGDELVDCDSVVPGFRPPASALFP